MSKAGGNLKQAKHFNNVIGDYIFDIPLENVSVYWAYKKKYLLKNYVVCIPCLHIIKILSLSAQAF